MTRLLIAFTMLAGVLAGGPALAGSGALRGWAADLQRQIDAGLPVGTGPGVA